MQSLSLSLSLSLSFSLSSRLYYHCVIVSYHKPPIFCSVGCVYFYPQTNITCSKTSYWHYQRQYYALIITAIIINENTGAKLLICNTLSYKRSKLEQGKDEQNTRALLYMYWQKSPKCYMLVVDRSTPHPQQIIYLLQIVDFIWRCAGW